MRNTLLMGCILLLTGACSAQSAAPPRIWQTCAACHASGTAAIGPPLGGIVGRPIASVPGFGYSRAMRSTSSTWDEALLSAFLEDPQQAIPGNRMPFAGIADPAERAELVAYLKSLR